MNRGDVVMATLPQPQGKAGVEQFGTRPVIILHATDARENLKSLVIVPCTSNLKALKFQGSFEIFPTNENGLNVNTIVLTHQIRALDSHRIINKIGKLSNEDLEKLSNELKAILGF